MELVEWHKKSTEKSHDKTQVNAVLEVRSQVDDFKVQFVQMFVDEGDQRFLDDLKLFRCMVKKCVEGVSFTSHANIIVGAGDDFLEFSIISIKQLSKVFARLLIEWSTYSTLNFPALFLTRTTVTETFSGKRIGARK